MNEPTDLTFCRELKNRKLFDMCPGLSKNLDQGPDGALKFCFFNIFITYEWMSLDSRDPKFFQGKEHQKIFDMCRGVFQNLDQGPAGA